MAPPVLTALMLAAVLPPVTLPVGEVTVEGLGPVPEALVRRVLNVQPGDPFSRTQVRRGVQALMATQQVDDVRVRFEHAPDGVRLEVWIQPRPRVAAVAVAGTSGRLERDVRTELSLVPGAPLNLGAFEARLERVREAILAAGYPSSEVTPWLDFDAATNTVAVSIEVRLGVPRRVVAVNVEGADLSSDQAFAATRLRPGQVLSARRLGEARRSLARYLRREGFWEAEVEEPRVEELPSGHRVGLFVVPGSRYALELDGVRLSRALRAEVFPFLTGDEPFNPGFVEGLIQQARLYLQREGNLLAELNAAVVAGDDPDSRVLQFSVDPGRKTPVTAVRFPGMESVPAARVLPRVGARTGRVWTWGAEPVDDETLQADVVSLTVTLQEEGFAEAVVESPRIVPEGRGVAIEFPVTEGVRFVVAELEVEGVPPSVDPGDLAMKVGGPWSLERQEQSREQVLDALREAGYADARVRVSRECPEGRCRVLVEAAPGLQVTVDRVVVAGLVRTRRRVVDRIARLRPGDPLSDDHLLEAQRRLLGVGLFQRINARVIPGQETGPQRGVVLEVEEGRTKGFTFGAGWNTEDQFRVSAGWSELNLFGTGRSLSVDGRISNREERFQISYREPARLGLLGFPTWVSLYRFEERLPAFDFLRRGTWVEFGDRMRRPRRLLLRYDYQIVGSDAPDEIKSELERDRQDLSIASLTPVLEWDTRDDIFSPRRGALVSLELQNAFKLFRADAAFTKLTASLAAHTPFRGGVLAVALRAGAIEPTGSSKEVVLPARFFAGGRVSHRAFPTDRLGVPGLTLSKAGDPVGGGGLLLASGEWRFGVWGPIGGVGFVDGGNVWPGWRDIDPGELRWGAGIGLRVETPVGPLRLEYAWKFDPEVLDPSTGLRESRTQLFLSFGNPF